MMQVQQTASGLWVPDRKIYTAPALGGKPGAVTMARRRASAWDPSMLADQAHRWDMEGTITAATDVTQVNDIIGTNHLTGTGHNDPLYVSSDGDLGSRKAAQHDRTNSEALVVTLTSTIAHPFTLWIIYTLDSLANTGGIMGDDPLGAANNSVQFNDATPDEWMMGQAGVNEMLSTVTTPAADTAYLLVAVFDGASSAMYVNNVDQSLNGTTTGTQVCTDMAIGSDAGNIYGDISWTLSGVTTAAMSSGDRTSLYNWAVANCGV